MPDKQHLTSVASPLMLASQRRMAGGHDVMCTQHIISQNGTAVYAGANRQWQSLSRKYAALQTTGGASAILDTGYALSRIPA